MSQVVEIERKFLVPTLPESLEDCPCSSLRQGYLAIADDAEVRLRERNGRHTETVKSTGDLERMELEIEISREQFETLWPATSGRRVEKTRYEKKLGHVVVELDVYHGALDGLITAEVEFEDREDAEVFSAPDWFGRELTRDPRYKNRNLATRGLPGAG